MVVRVLADDERGSRHQRFIIRPDSAQTLLVAHNIPLSTAVRSGDRHYANTRLTRST